MDALALLCTLHAEGPRTLRLLREAGCRDVGDFLALDSEVVAALLDVPPAVARRLSREGRHLSQRIGSEFLEPEDGQVSAQRAAVPGIPGGAPFGAFIEGPGAGSSSVPGEAEATQPEPWVGAQPATPPTSPENAVQAARLPLQDAERGAAPGATAGGVPASTEATSASDSAAGRIPVDAYLNRSERQILDKVLERWRERDGQTVDAAQAPRVQPEREGLAEVSWPTTGSVELRPATSDPVTASSEGSSPDAKSRAVDPPPLRIDGVPADRLVALEAAGYTTPAAVQAAGAMALAGAVGCSFGDARRFQFLAGRAVQREAAEAERRSPLAESKELSQPDLPAPSPPTGAEREAEAALVQRLIERPPSPAQGSTQRPVAGVPSPGAPQASGRTPVPFEPLAPMPAPEPAPEPEASQPNGPQPGAWNPGKPTTRTVLNWDFVSTASAEPVPGASEPASRVAEVAPEPGQEPVDGEAAPGGPFA